MAVVGSILARLQADAGPLNRGLTLASSRVTRFEKGTADSLRRIDRRTADTMALLARTGTVGFMGLAKGATLALAPILSVSAAIAGAKAGLQEFGDIADNAKAAGLGTDTFQGLAYQAELAGVGFEAFSQGLASFARNSGLAVAGKGRMLTALKALNPELLKNIVAATTQEERVRLAADAISKAGNASERAALSTALFGEAGIKLGDAFSSGAAGIDATLIKARELGLVVDRDLIARAEQMGDEFETASKILDLQFKTILVELAPLLTGTAMAIGGMVNAVQDLWKTIGESPQMAHIGAITAPLNVRALPIMRDQVTSKRAILDSGEWLFDRGALEREVAALERAILDRTDPTKFDVGASFAGLGSTFGSVDALRQSLGGDTGGSASVSGSGSTTTRNEAAAAALRQADAVKKLIDDLDFERSLIGKSEAEQRALTAARQAGAAAATEQRNQIYGTVIAIEAERAALAELEDKLQTAESLTKDFARGIVGDLRQGVGVVESLGNAFGRLGDRLIDMALDQAISTLFGNLTGTLFGGLGGGGTGFIPTITGPSLFATGGYTGPGGKYEPAGIVHAGEYVFDAASVKRIGVGALDAMRMRGYAEGGYVGPSMPRMPALANAANSNAANDNTGVNINLNTYINAQGSTMTEAQFKAMLNERDKAMRDQLPAMVKKIQSQPRRAYV